MPELQELAEVESVSTILEYSFCCRIHQFLIAFFRRKGIQYRLWYARTRQLPRQPERNVHKRPNLPLRCSDQNLFPFQMLTEVSNSLGYIAKGSEPSCQLVLASMQAEMEQQVLRTQHECINVTKGG